MSKEQEQQIIRDAIIEAMQPAVTMQALSLKAVLTPDEVCTLYGISASTLEKMRAENRGPAYSQLARHGKVLYTRENIDKWIRVQTIEPRVI